MEDVQGSLVLIILGGNYLGAIFLGGICAGDNFLGGIIVWGTIVLGGNFLGGLSGENCPVPIIYTL